MEAIRFLDNDGTFQVEQPENYSYLYFSIAGEKGLKSAVTPNLSGDSKINQEAFLLEPVSSENLHNNRSTRNFWCIVEAEITSFAPVDDNVEIMHVVLSNTAKTEQKISPVAVVPIYGRSADNIRDHRNVTSMLHRIYTQKYGVTVKPTMSFDENSWFVDVRLKIRGQEFFKVVIYLPNLIMASAFGTRSLIGVMNFLMLFGNTTIMLMAAIMGISPDIFEAGEIDGCNSAQRFFLITLPLIRPILAYTLIVSIIGGLQMFDVPQIITNGQGNPDRTSMTLIMFLNSHLRSKNYGMAGALSVYLFIVSGILYFIVYRITNDDDPDGSKAPAFPLSLVEAARIDGSWEFRTFNQIVLPIMKPAMAVQAIFTFVGSWNNYFVPALVIQSKDKMTVPILIALLCGADYMNSNRDILNGYRLVWEEQFDGDALNMDNWSFVSHPPGWVNQELQEYVESSDYAYVRDGKLVIQPVKVVDENGKTRYLQMRNSMDSGPSAERLTCIMCLPVNGNRIS